MSAYNKSAIKNSETIRLRLVKPFKIFYIHCWLSFHHNFCVLLFSIAFMFASNISASDGIWHIAFIVLQYAIGLTHAQLHQTNWNKTIHIFIILTKFIFSLNQNKRKGFHLWLCCSNIANIDWNECKRKHTQDDTNWQARYATSETKLSHSTDFQKFSIHFHDVVVVVFHWNVHNI